VAVLPLDPSPDVGEDPLVRSLHRAWIISVVAFVTLLGAAGMRAAPGVMMDPLHDEFGWSHGTIGTAMSINLLLFGLTSPFAAALMDRFGIRRVATFALTLVAIGSGLTVLMTQAWQLQLLWGVLVGIGTGSLAMAFVATITTRWFVARRGLVSGILTAAGATGQLVFLPVLSALTSTTAGAPRRWSWRSRQRPSSRSSCSSSATIRTTWACAPTARRRTNRGRTG
jgi:MFS family permease